ncbi:hypothetical protein [Fervidobacterium changbaicum]|uniref:hypothetical protein n=1 Tax=Fervidobacterium changbaicum TaxID=310769 RepID=UPI0013E91C3B|nr:hypothetical protein [Fervidobacterium changbaicum]
MEKARPIREKMIEEKTYEERKLHNGYEMLENIRIDMSKKVCSILYRCRAIYY